MAAISAGGCVPSACAQRSRGRRRGAFRGDQLAALLAAGTEQLVQLAQLCSRTAASATALRAASSRAGGPGQWPCP